LGVSGQIDYVDASVEGGVMPVDYKKGKPAKGGTLWKPDRVQLVLQALLLRAKGYDVSHIAAWYAGARKRVELELTNELEEEALQAVRDAKLCSQGDVSPLPLEEAPQCMGCSLQPICLPDEVLALQVAERALVVSDDEVEEPVSVIRRVQPPKAQALPLYIQEQGSRIGIRKGTLQIKPSERSGESQNRQVGLQTVSQLNVMGGVQVSTQALQACLRADVPVSFFSTGGWYYGQATGHSSKQVHLRIGQYNAYQTDDALVLARRFIADKIANCRTFLRRNAGSVSGVIEELPQLKRLIGQVEEATSPEQLLGFEGDAARRYWGLMSSLFASVDERFGMNGRNRRPPLDPTNAMLSYGYALLLKDVTLALSRTGLDPYLGMLHTPHHGNPALALDVMEPFRPIVVDSVVLQVIKRGEVKPEDFVCSGQAVAMKSSARKALLRGYERRMSECITHPVFGYRISYRSILSVQARLLSRVFVKEIPELPSFRTR
jgi:CRISPR-associated protein Cas1